MANKVSDKKQTGNNDDLPDFDQFIRHKTGFAPFWTPEEGKMLYGIPYEIDDKDPKFVRIMFRSLMTLTCGSGSEKSGNFEEVIVRKGEIFAISDYDNIHDALFFFVNECDFPVPVYIRAERKVPTKSGQEVWKFDLRTHNDVTAKIDARKHELLMDAQERKAIESR
jgi:hypothetical protein